MSDFDTTAARKEVLNRPAYGQTVDDNLLDACNCIDVLRAKLAEMTAWHEGAADAWLEIKAKVVAKGQDVELDAAIHAMHKYKARAEAAEAKLADAYAEAGSYSCRLVAAEARLALAEEKLAKMAADWKANHDTWAGEDARAALAGDTEGE